jgi:hypothetical protein
MNNHRFFFTLFVSHSDVHNLKNYSDAPLHITVNLQILMQKYFLQFSVNMELHCSVQEGCGFYYPSIEYYGTFTGVEAGGT